MHLYATSSVRVCHPPDLAACPAHAAGNILSNNTAVYFCTKNSVRGTFDQAQAWDELACTRGCKHVYLPTRPLTTVICQIISSSRVWVCESKPSKQGPLVSNVFGISESDPNRIVSVNPKPLLIAGFPSSYAQLISRQLVQNLIVNLPLYLHLEKVYRLAQH
jgi:hypothetical protein